MKTNNQASVNQLPLWRYNLGTLILKVNVRISDWFSGFKAPWANILLENRKIERNFTLRKKNDLKIRVTEMQKHSTVSFKRYLTPESATKALVTHPKPENVTTQHQVVPEDCLAICQQEKYTKGKTPFVLNFAQENHLPFIIQTRFQWINTLLKYLFLKLLYVSNVGGKSRWPSGGSQEEFLMRHTLLGLAINPFRNPLLAKQYPSIPTQHIPIYGSIYTKNVVVIRGVSTENGKNKQPLEVSHPLRKQASSIHVASSAAPDLRPQREGKKYRIKLKKGTLVDQQRIGKTNKYRFFKTVNNHNLEITNLKNDQYVWISKKKYNQYATLTKAKLRHVFVRIAEHQHKLGTAGPIILGPYGCGAFLNNPYEVATFYKELLEEPAFKNRFPHIIWSTFKKRDPNHKVFSKMFEQTT